ncbi:aspartate/glutamate racemase family protein [Methylobrevis pamukkalensis]|uniref:Asp/Glu/Hydantoin racemase n=1 Tax=Methylobrevis pamukkalensis TaxID=1439726 RepID=A0A1E3GYD6_9HYPH|nr:aspartate/glutamate racemase family protein [Methylobrevis pamukkalensis]ODN69077.1 Asp/Glu/Hydantoin racemase [Methylobrevis pamukkalensis]
MGVLLINPNTSAAATDLMVAVARRAAAGRLAVTGATAAFGAPLITDETSLAIAADAVIASASEHAAGDLDGVIVAAFGDPGLEVLKARLGCPVVGLAEASMMEAAAGGRRFSVATTTPRLVDAIRRCAVRHGLARQLLSIRTTPGDPETVMADLTTLRGRLREEVRSAIEEDGAEAVIIGGGPLADAATDLARELATMVIEPVPAAIRALLGRKTSMQAAG